MYMIMFRNRPLSWLKFYKIRSACSIKLWKNMMIPCMFWNIMCSGHIIKHTKKDTWLWYPTKKNYLALILSKKNYLAFIWTQKKIWLPIKYKAPPPGYQMGRPLGVSKHTKWFMVSYTCPCITRISIWYLYTNRCITQITTWFSCIYPYHVD